MKRPSEWLVPSVVFVCLAGAYPALGQAPSMTVEVAATPTPRVDRLAFSPDGKLLAALGDDVTDDNRAALLLYEPAKGTLLARLPLEAPFSGDVLAFTADGKQVVTASLPAKGGDPTVEFWDVATRKRTSRVTVGAGQVGRGEVSPDGRMIAYPAARVRLFDLRSGKELMALTDREEKPSPEPPVRPRSATCLAFSRDGKSLVAGFSDGRLALWELPRGKCLWSVQKLDKRCEVAHVAFSPDGASVVSAPGYAAERRLAINRRKDGGEDAAIHYGYLGVYPRDPRVVFAPDGTSVLLGGYRRGLAVYRWDLKANTLYEARPPEPGLRDPAICIAVSPDGKLLATARRTIQLWDVSKIGTRLKPE